jgi:hypothetical protein
MIPNIKNLLTDPTLGGPGSNLGSQTCYPDGGFSQFNSVPPDQCQNKPLQFIVHCELEGSSNRELWSASPLAVTKATDTERRNRKWGERVYQAGGLLRQFHTYKLYRT